MALQRLEPDRSVLLFIDLQERFAPVIHRWEEVLTTAERAAHAAELLELPVLLTEQYPKGLGRTVPPLVQALGERYLPIEKRAFSACGAEGFSERLQALGRDQVILLGIEAHVCVLQSCLDLLEGGWSVFALADGISSRRPEDRALGLGRMERAGAVLVSLEMALFELIRSAAHPRFREVQALIK